MATILLRPRLIMLIVCIILTTGIEAFEVNNVCYQVNDDDVTLSVVKPNRNYCNTTSVEVPEKVTYGGRTFTVTKVCSFAFTYQAATVSLPSTIEEIEEQAFEKSEVVAVYFRGQTKFKTIPVRCFFLCKHLKDIRIPHSVTTIESEAFVGCYMLREIVVPSSVVKIEASAFNDGRLPKDSRNTMRELVFEDGALDLVIYPVSYEGISDVCKRLYVGRNIIMYPPYENREVAWFGWQLEEATIGSNVTKLSDHLFLFCSELKSLKIEPLSPPTISKKTLSVDKKKCTLYVPKGQADKYESLPFWNDFHHIQEFTK